MSGPKREATISGWELRRWEYDNAPLLAEKKWHHERNSMEIVIEKDTLDIEVVRDSDYYPGTTNDSYTIPLAVLRALLADYDRSRLPPTDESE